MMKLDHHLHHHHRLLLDTEDSEPSAADGTGTRTRNFDTNMVIILAALLCALICALGLNSIVRCALRCGRRRLPFEAADETSRTTAKGLNKRALNRIPVAVYGSGISIPSTDCAICLGEFMEGEKVRVLPKCRHGFHVSCIDLWLASHSSCPTCRRSLLEQPASSDPADGEGGLRHPSGRHSDDVPGGSDEEVG